MQLYYSPDVSDEELTLPESEAFHIYKVMRSRVGDEIQLTDGKGMLLTLRLTEVSGKLVRGNVIKRDLLETRKPSLHIAIAPTKNNERFEWFLEKATEIGVETITPIICRNSQRKDVKFERLNKVIVSAGKQSLKLNFPVLNNLQLFRDFLQMPHQYDKLIAHCHDITRSDFRNALNSPHNALILIGPEGDFTIDEINDAVKNDFREVSFGSNRMRTETAGLYACAAFSLLKTH